LKIKTPPIYFGFLRKTGTRKTGVHPVGTVAAVILFEIGDAVIQKHTGLNTDKYHIEKQGAAKTSQCYVKSCKDAIDW